MLTGEQIRAARAWARVSQADLAKRAGVSVETIKRLERMRGRVDAYISTVESLERAFADLGVRLFNSRSGDLGVGPLDAPVVVIEDPGRST